MAYTDELMQLAEKLMKNVHNEAYESLNFDDYETAQQLKPSITRIGIFKLIAKHFKNDPFSNSNVDTFISKLGPLISYRNDIRSHFTPVPGPNYHGTIIMPFKECYKNKSFYYQDLFHNLILWARNKHAVINPHSDMEFYNENLITNMCCYLLLHDFKLIDDEIERRTVMILRHNEKRLDELIHMRTELLEGVTNPSDLILKIVEVCINQAVLTVNDLHKRFVNCQASKEDLAFLSCFL